MKLDRQTVLLLISMAGGASTAGKLASDVADIRERVARIETRLDYKVPEGARASADP